MPPRAALQAVLTSGGHPRRTRRVTDRRDALAPPPLTYNPLIAGPSVHLVRSDIFTYGAQAAVIATDVDMKRRKQFPAFKFHELAGKNFRRWNKNVHYRWRLNPVTGRVSRVPRLAPTLAVKSPSFQTTTNNWFVMVNVPDFVPGPAIGRFQGNGDQLYRCYINAFEAARAAVNLNVPPALMATLQPNALPTLPTTIAFSFIGPEYGWDMQDAANIAIAAIRDAFWGVAAAVTPAERAANLASFTRVTIVCSHVERQDPVGQQRALTNAWNHVFNNAAIVAPAVLALAGVVPLGSKQTRSGRVYG